MSGLYPFLRRGIEQVIKHGPSLLYWRYWKRKQILNADPVTCPVDADLEVHTLVCERDWLNAFWTLYSFHHFSESHFRLVVLHDGWLNNHDNIKRAFERSFSGVIVENRDSLASRVKREVGGVLSEMWHTEDYPTLAKVIDSVLLASSARVIFLDPDVLFFDFPKELVEGAQDLNGVSARWNFPAREVNRDALYSCNYVDLNEAIEDELPQKFQIGLGVYDTEFVDFDSLNRVLRDVPEIRAGASFMIDQTAFGILAARHGYNPLPSDRYVTDPVETLEGVIARHYHSHTRDLMYVEGFPAVSERLLSK